MLSPGRSSGMDVDIHSRRQSWYSSTLIPHFHLISGVGGTFRLEDHCFLHFYKSLSFLFKILYLQCHGKATKNCITDTFCFSLPSVHFPHGPSHSCLWYSSGIFLLQPQIITIFYEYHHPKLFYDWCRDGLPYGNREGTFFFFFLLCWELCWNSLEFLNSIRTKSWRNWYSWSTWTLSSIHVHSLDNLISWPKKIWVCLCQFELSFFHLQLNEFWLTWMVKSD